MWLLRKYKDFFRVNLRYTCTPDFDIAICEIKLNPKNKVRSVLGIADLGFLLSTVFAFFNKNC